MSKKRTDEHEETDSSGESAESQQSTAALIEVLRAQQRQQQEQQQLLMSLLEEQKAEIARSREEREREKNEHEKRTSSDEAESFRLPKPTLQRLEADDDIEHFLLTFERIATQQRWPKEIWATQLAGLLTGKAMAAYATLSSADSTSFEEVKKAVLSRYDVSEETHRMRFRQDRKKQGESYRNWSDRLRDHFGRWTAARGWKS